MAKPMALVEMVVEMVALLHHSLSSSKSKLRMKNIEYFELIAPSDGSTLTKTTVG